MSRSVGTGPTFALLTRKGTGFYKVPTLLGVSYRGPFEHNGSCATLMIGSTRNGCAMIMCRQGGKVRLAPRRAP